MAETAGNIGVQFTTTWVHKPNNLIAIPVKTKSAPYTQAKKDILHHSQQDCENMMSMVSWLLFPYLHMDYAPNLPYQSISTFCTFIT